MGVHQDPPLWRVTAEGAPVDLLWRATAFRAALNEQLGTSELAEAAAESLRDWLRGRGYEVRAEGPT